MKKYCWLLAVLMIGTSVHCMAGEFECKGSYPQGNVPLVKYLKFTAKQIRFKDPAGTLVFDRAKGVIEEGVTRFTLEQGGYYSESLSLLISNSVLESIDEIKKFSFILRYVQSAEGADISRVDTKLACRLKD